jgi:hypothetical protein
MLIKKLYHLAGSVPVNPNMVMVENGMNILWMSYLVLAVVRSWEMLGFTALLEGISGHIT